MTHAIGRAATTAVHEEPHPRAPVVSQLVLGETAVVEERRGHWRQVRLPGGDVAGWTHSATKKAAPQAVKPSIRLLKKEGSRVMRLAQGKNGRAAISPDYSKVYFFAKPGLGIKIERGLRGYNRIFAGYFFLVLARQDLNL
jgi:hypothetical protein